VSEITDTHPELRIRRVALPFLLPWDSYPKLIILGHDTEVPSPTVWLWTMGRSGRRWFPRIWNGER